MSDNKRLLMVFVQNALLGKMKSKLAKEIGEKQAIEIYLTLLNHTHIISNKPYWDKAVLYSQYIEYNDIWKQSGFFQFVQEGKDKGARMHHAFRLAFNIDYERVVLINSDCLELSEEILQNAFKALEANDVVIGPASDGGYYLIGMNKLYPELFENKVWGDENVLTDTILDLRRLNLSYHLLETLTGMEEQEGVKLFRKNLSSEQ
ncbi:MAG TPA: TIGR04282 family arsenosugar biosynthesis glycosyltransferase [Cytophagaceae bacterium]